MKRRDFLRLMGIAAPAVVATTRAIIESRSVEPALPEMSLERYSSTSSGVGNVAMKFSDLDFPIRRPGPVSMIKSDLGAVYNPIV